MDRQETFTIEPTQMKADVYAGPLKLEIERREDGAIAGVVNWVEPELPTDLEWLKPYWRKAQSAGLNEEVTLPENELRSLLYAIGRSHQELRQQAGVEFRGKVWGDGSCTGIIIDPVRPYDVNVRSLLDLEVVGTVRPAEE
jgi:hypothetical protein